MAAPIHDQPLDLPVNDAAESAVLGACLNSPVALDDAATILRPEMFWHNRHERIFATLLEMREKGLPTDPIAVSNYWDKRELIRNGGAPYLHELYSSVLTAAQATYHAEIIRDAYARRQVIALSQRMASLSRANADEVTDILEQCRTELDNLTNGVRGRTDVFASTDIIPELLGSWTSPEPVGVGTGWSDLDSVLGGGLRPGQLIVVGARPATGKSLVGTNLARSLSRHGKKVQFFSLEMTRQELMTRMIADVANVHMGSLVRHRLSDDDWARVHAAEARMKSWTTVDIIDNPTQRLADIRSVARNQKRKPDGLDCIIIDYLALIEPADRRIERHNQVAEISRGLKVLAKELEVPVVAIHQLNRNPEGRVGRKPALSDMRESGAVEQDADVAILLHRDEDDEERSGEIDMIVAKNRQGPTTTVTMIWEGEKGRIQAFSKDDKDWA